jgi:hypothetical protein
MGSWPSLLRCWRCASDTSCSQGARQVPLKRTVFRHTKLSETSRESFELAGKLLDTAERLLGDLDPKVPIGRPIALGHVGGTEPYLPRFDRLKAPGIGVADPDFGRGNGPPTRATLADCGGPNTWDVRG